ncbi:MULTISPECIES: nitrilase-related carbon-nitrogen hydrolase [unclassified Halomonas]|uniref:NAD+ synthetase n=1 Tax=Halomonas sp. RT37 TaxID=2950872 RepID=A0AAU7KDC5_9GAMM|nr:MULTISPECIES: nitrilase-related carbon-nitrogen hydrolase [unclassified Halomonas]MBR9773426.1 NAD+ synthetase [Gammaproteobacteria bacterium]MBS8271365.1 NAD+ synthetase [Halomonas litopenaei]MBR9882108.1 NAD+ synthetase [Gammaproteobacteria bacterium]MBY5941159.1 NAD+ synthetase [Halomonas sp. DP5N14-9]MCJ8287012.1 NAD+ synthetase [Halomonas sp.]|tara:strand:- start:340 stop:1197 length:858 start_codon:yes stop_codon:yes gene_type:complete
MQHQAKQHQDQLQVACAQINARLGDVEANLAHHLDVIHDARRRGVELLVFPELSLTGYGLGPRVLEVAMPSEDPRLIQLAKAAAGMQVIVGFVEEASPGEIYNALAILQDGRIAAVHRKLNLPTYGGLEEGKWFSHGARLTEVAVRPGWSTTSMICADLWNPALVHAALLARPTVLCAPINSASGIVSEDFSNEENWALNVRFYAMTYGTPVLMANRYGPEGDSHFWGGSRILGPRGESLAEAEDRETLICAELSRTAIARARFELPTLRDADSPLIRELMSGYR